MKGTFEMPGDGFVDVGLIGVLDEHPFREPFVQVGAELLRETSVRRLTDE